MRGIQIDPRARIARVGAGARWHDVVEAAARHGLAALAGSSPDVGVIGSTLGGGISFLGRKHGLASHMFSEPRGIALAADNPLAQKSEVTIEEFIEEPTVDVPMIDPVCRDFWIGAKHRRGKPARIGATVQTLDGLIEAIGAGLGVAGTVAPAVDAIGATAGVAFRPVPGLEPLEFWVASRTGDARPQVTDFIDVAVAAHASAVR